MDFSSEEPWEYTIGTEEGSIINGVLQGSLNIEKEEVSIATMAPVTSVSNHPNKDTDLILVSSVDWTVKIHQKSTQKNLVTFDSYDDYVYDAKWNPNIHSLFACSDGDGNLDIWDVGKNLESPYARLQTSSKSLNKIAWDCNGTKIAAGNSVSAVYIYQLDKDYSHPKGDDWMKNLLY